MRYDSEQSEVFHTGGELLPCCGPKGAEKDENLAISEGDQRAPGDQFKGICDYTHSEYILDAFISVSTGSMM